MSNDCIEGAAYLGSVTTEVKDEYVSCSAGRDELGEVIFDILSGRLNAGRVSVDQSNNVGLGKAVILDQHRLDRGDVVDTSIQRGAGTCTSMGVKRNLKNSSRFPTRRRSHVRKRKRTRQPQARGIRQDSWG